MMHGAMLGDGTGVKAMVYVMKVLCRTTDNAKYRE